MSSNSEFELVTISDVRAWLMHRAMWLESESQQPYNKDRERSCMTYTSGFLSAMATTHNLEHTIRSTADMHAKMLSEQGKIDY